MTVKVYQRANGLRHGYWTKISCRLNKVTVTTADCSSCLMRSKLLAASTGRCWYPEITYLMSTDRSSRYVYSKAIPPFYCNKWFNTATGPNICIALSLQSFACFQTYQPALPWPSVYCHAYFTDRRSERVSPCPLYTNSNGASPYARSFTVCDNRSEKYQILGLIDEYCMLVAWYIQSKRMEKCIQHSSVWVNLLFFFDGIWYSKSFKCTKTRK